MDRYEKIGYSLLALVAACWLLVVLFGVIVAFPFGLFGLLGIVGIGVLFIKVIRERLHSKDDDYYSKNVDR
jgi:hypothetical protein